MWYRNSSHSGGRKRRVTARSYYKLGANVRHAVKRHGLRTERNILVPTRSEYDKLGSVWAVGSGVGVVAG
jgi:hypothetical protein